MKSKSVKEKKERRFVFKLEVFDPVDAGQLASYLGNYTLDQFLKLVENMKKIYGN